MKAICRIVLPLLLLFQLPVQMEPRDSIKYAQTVDKQNELGPHNSGIRYRGPSTSTWSGWSGLVAYWHFDETTGTRVDAYASYDLTDVNTVGYGTGKNGNAADFTEADSEYLNFAAAPFAVDTSAGLTVAGWVKPTSRGYIFCGDTVAGANRLWNLEWNDGGGTGYIDFYFFGSGSWVTASSDTVAAGSWSHFIAWWDPSDGKGYISINGAAARATAGTIAALNSNPTIPIEVGELTAFSNPYDGLLDEYTIWNRVLTSGERTSLYNGGTGRFYPN